jgi:RNA polymerase sigma-70 factor (ECF subfamily)
MAEEIDFARWMARVRAGDAAAAEELVRRYERHIRIAVRARLSDPFLRRQFDSADVCQSVLQSFFVRAAAGQFDLDSAQQLIGLLVRIAQNKFGMRARYHRRQCRDLRRDDRGSPDLLATPDTAPGPEAQVASRELLHALLDALQPEERELAQRRALGQTWKEIADELGGIPATHRMRLRRGIDRVAPALGLDQVDSDDE